MQAQNQKHPLLIGIATILFLMMAAFVMMSFAGSVSATQSDIALADLYYEEAEKLFNSRNCENASNYALNSLNLYLKYGNQQGIDKCNALIVKVNKCLRDQGYNYYLQSLKSFNNEDYESAKTFAEKAKKLYVLVPYPEGIADCNEIINNSEEKLNEITTETGERLYELARSYYAKKDYPSAKISATKAKEIFSKVPFPDGVQRAESLLKNIEIDIIQTNERANVFYTYAEQWRMKSEIDPKFRNFNLAKEYAENASKLYSLVNNTDGYAKCLSLIDIVQKKLAENENKLRSEAQGFYDSAELNFLDARRYFYQQKYEKTYELLNNASTFSSTAKSIYTELLLWARDLKNPKDRNKKENYYKIKIKECNDQKDKINAEINLIETRKSAENLYEEAQRLYNDAWYDNASTTIAKAKSIFEKIGDWVGVSKCNTLILKVDQAIEIKQKADGFYDNARALYDVAEFDDAIPDLKEAKKIYEGINRKIDVEKCDEFLKNLTEANKSKTRAEDFYQTALDFYEQGTFTRSKENAIDAKKLFEKVNYSDGIEKTKELITKNDKELVKVEDLNRFYQNIIIGAAAIAVIIIALRWWFEKKKKEDLRRKAFEAERRKKEEERRRIEEEKKRKELARLKLLREEQIKIKTELEREKSKLKNTGDL